MFLYWSFTAAGLSGIFTRFPFNPHIRMVYGEPIGRKYTVLFEKANKK